MKKYFCDRCGKETINKRNMILTVKDLSGQEIKEGHDLCDDCVSKIDSLITGWERVVKNAGPEQDD